MTTLLDLIPSYVSLPDKDVFVYPLVDTVKKVVTEISYDFEYQINHYWRIVASFPLDHKIDPYWKALQYAVDFMCVFGDYDKTKKYTEEDKILVFQCSYFLSAYRRWTDYKNYN